jgi:hypothetical protein
MGLPITVVQERTRAAAFVVKRVDLPVHERLALAATRVTKASTSTPPATSIRVTSTIHRTASIDILPVGCRSDWLSHDQVGKPLRP